MLEFTQGVVEGLIIWWPLGALGLGVWVLNSFRTSGDQWDQYHK
jgi:hypothetical protein